MDAEPYTAVSNVHVRRLEGEMRRSDSSGGTGMQHTSCLQTIFKVCSTLQESRYIYPRGLATGFRRRC